MRLTSWTFDVVQFERLFVEVLWNVPDVEFALLQSDELGICRAEVFEDNARQFGPAAVVILVALKFDELVALGLHEFERPGADVEFRHVPSGRVVFHDIFRSHLVEDVRRQNLQVSVADRCQPTLVSTNSKTTVKSSGA